MGSLGVWDVGIVVLSLVLVMALGAYSSTKKRKQGQAESFFLGGRDMPWWVVGGSLFASNIGTEHFVGQAGSAAYSGLAVGLYDWSAAYLILALGWVFAPVYLRCNLTTTPELLELRFNKYCRSTVVMITLFAYVVSKLGSSMYAGTVVLKVVAGLGIWESLPLILIGTALYTISGGLTAVMLVDTAQMGIFLLGGILGSIIAFSKVGGISGLFGTLNSADLTDFPHLLRSTSDRDYPWPGMLFGIPVVSIWYWCVDQEMAQRVISAKDLGEAQMGTGFAALFKALPVFITVFPGMVARALFEICKSNQQDQGDLAATGSESDPWCNANLDSQDHADHAYPLLVVNEFPMGVRGIMVASFLAAMMSSLSSVFNSASTIFTYDVYQRFFASEGRESSSRLVHVGRITTAILALLAFAWIPVIASQNRGLFELTQIAMTHLAPPVSALYIAALFFRRANEQGALSGLLMGVLVGVVRLGLYLGRQGLCDASVSDGNSQKLTWSNWILCLNFNYFALVLFGFTLLAINLISLFYPPPSASQVDGQMVVLPWLSKSRSSPRASQVEITNVQHVRLGSTSSPVAESSMEESETNPIVADARKSDEPQDAELARMYHAELARMYLASVRRKQTIAAGLGGISLVLISSLIITFH